MRSELVRQEIKSSPIRYATADIRIIGSSRADVEIVAKEMGVELQSVKIGRGEEWLGYGKKTVKVGC